MLTLKVPAASLLVCSLIPLPQCPYLKSRINQMPVFHEPVVGNFLDMEEYEEKY